MITKETLLKIKKLALNIDHDVAFGGKSKGNKHLLRVIRIVDFLAKKTGANRPIAAAGAFLHDTALPTGDDYNYTKNKEIVKGLLSSFDITADELEQIAECVASHEGTEGPKSLEAQIVHDADVIEKLGILGMIRHTWKMTNFNKINSESVQDSDVKMVLEHIAWRQKKIQTPLAKKIGKYLNKPVPKQKAKLIVLLASKMAFKGIVTEKIAIALRRHLSQAENERLKEQLDLGYLRRFDA